MTGWRLGYGIMPAELVPHISRLATNSVSCAASFSQIAGVAALDGPQDSVQEMAAEFGRRRRLIADGLASIPGINCPEPEGAFLRLPQHQGHRPHQRPIRGAGHAGSRRRPAVRRGLRSIR